MEYFENPVIAKDGTLYEIEWHNSIIYGDSGEIIGMLSAGNDITESKKLKTEIEDTNVQLTNLTKHIQDLRENERQALAREIHDDLGQTLTALKMDLKSIQKNILPANQEAINKTDAAGKLVDQAIKTTQQITSELRPGLIDDLGLLAALEWYTDQYIDRTGLELNREFLLDEEDIPSSFKITFYRIVQEALNNVTKHAEAKKVQIILSTDGEFVQLTIQDNGKGISESDITKADSFGLLGMRERAQAIGGKLQIDSTQGKGTTIRLRVKL